MAQENDSGTVPRSRPHYEEYLDPGLALGLGFAPFGIAGFYVHRPGLGVSGILCWPLSVLWMPGAAYQSANDYNYRELHDRIVALREQAAGGAAAAGSATGVEHARGNR